MNIRLYVTDSERVLARLGDLPDKVQETLVEYINYAVERLYQIIEGKLTGQVLHVVTGRLADSVSFRLATRTNSRVVAGSVTQDGRSAPYGIIQERGSTSPYQILPSKKRVLSFLWRGKQVFLKSVTHPAIIRRPFMGTSLEEIREEIPKGIRTALRGI